LEKPENLVFSGFFL